MKSDYMTTTTDTKLFAHIFHALVKLLKLRKIGLNTFSSVTRRFDLKLGHEVNDFQLAT